MKYVRDPPSDLITRIKNAVMASHDSVSIPFSKFKLSIVKILKDEGFIIDYHIENDDSVLKSISITLKYDKKGQSVISSIKRLSKSSKRLYVAKKQIPKVLNGFGIVILSTSSGVLSGKQARLSGVGGELIAEVY